jgi:hypothetical protein
MTDAAYLSAAAGLALVLTAWSAAAQELEPGAYWPLPTGLNVVTVSNTFNVGDVAFEPAAPIDEARATINTTALAFTRAFNLSGRSANISVVVPVIAGHLEGIYLGDPAEVDRFGHGDPRIRFAMNVFGAPAMNPQAFAGYQQRTIAGASITVIPPLGQYDEARLINLGTNRWSFKPEIGMSRARGSWVLETAAGVWLFADNANFFGGRRRRQDPITALQVHVTYRFTRTIWLAANANYFFGGRTTIGDRQNADLQRNSRIGATFSSAIGRGQAIRVALSHGAFTTIGAAFTSIGVGYNYAWAQ